jgi:hypothetical protein
MQYLEAHGLVPRTPTIRSSDWEMAAACPFQYYLRRRLGLSSALSFSNALATGSWFHEWCALLLTHSLSDARPLIHDLFEDRLTELRAICETQGISGEELQSVLDRELQAYTFAAMLFEVAHDYPVPTIGSLHTFLHAPHIQPLGVELRFSYEHAEYPGVHLVGQYDLLYYHAQQNHVGIVDFKTTSEPTDVRLATCPLEFQTQHYMHILRWLLVNGTISALYPDVPQSARPGPMLHIAIQKPTIRFGLKDRDYTETAHTLSRGPRAGQTEMRRTYAGEPKLSNFVRRCRHWFYGTDEYESRLPEVNTIPPVNVSSTSGQFLADANWMSQYHTRLSYLHELATQRAYPGDFWNMASANAVRVFGKLSPLHQFYLTPVAAWPEIVARERLITTWRDEDLLQENDS